MLITAFFAIYGMIFAGVFKTKKISKDSTGTLIFFCLPWLFMIVGATYWAFVKDPPDYISRMHSGDYFAVWLICVAMVSVPLSYAAAHKLGSLSGYLAGESQTRLVLSPILLPSGHVGAYFFPDSSPKEGGELFCGGQAYIVSSVQPTEGLLYVVANRKPNQADER